MGDPPFNGSINLTGDGARYEVLFRTPGTYRYGCSINSDMSGAAIVQ
jgi:plastocyanin